MIFTSSNPIEKDYKGKKLSAAGLIITVHKTWPDLQLCQSTLFFECTLFRSFDFLLNYSQFLF